MSIVGAGDAEMNRHARGNQDAMGDKEKLLRDHAHGDGTIRILLGAEIIFDELPGEMQRCGIDPRSVQRAHQRFIDLIEASSGNEAKNQRGQHHDADFAPIHSSYDAHASSVVTPCEIYAKSGLQEPASSLSTALQRSQTVG